MALRPECKVIASWGIITLLALGDAARLHSEHRYKDAFDANARAIGWLYTSFDDKAINREELNEVTDPIIEANAAYQRGKVEDVCVPFEAVDRIADLFLQKACQCQCEKETGE